MNINLIDWRRRQNFVANNRFYAVLGAVVVVCALITASGNLIVMFYKSRSKSNVVIIDKELHVIEGDIKKIQDIQKQIENILTKRKEIETLQKSRTFLVKAWNDVAQIMPAGIVLSEMSNKLNTIDLIGTSSNNEEVASLLQNIQQLNWVKSAKISEIKTAHVSGQQGEVVASSRIDFRLEITVKPDEGVDKDAKNS